jgi:hypothetical protein
MNRKSRALVAQAIYVALAIGGLVLAAAAGWKWC